MKFTLSFILTVLLSFTFCLFLPWWSIAIAAFIVAALIPQKPGKAFATAFTALLVLWGCLCFWISFNNDHILAHKVSILILKMDSPVLLISVTTMIGSTVAGFAALMGNSIRVKKKF